MARMPSVRLLISASKEQAARLRDAGPRRDFWALAEATRAEVVYATDGSGSKGRLRKLIGPHVRQAWRAAKSSTKDVAFADGEHNGLPYALFAGLRGGRSGRLVLLGHLLTKPWKLNLLWLASRIGPRGVLFVHSTLQAEAARGRASSRWDVRLIPYQVDADFWTPADIESPSQRPLVVAVGAENRDYATFAKAVEGLAAEVVIAGASHWARAVPAADLDAAGLTVLTEPLDYTALRDLYQRAALVVVPLLDVPNQSGVTTLLEAMAVGRPVIVTASRGQREVVAGPLVRGDRTFDVEATLDRGPHAVLVGALPDGPTGLYVAPGDDVAMRAAIQWVLSHPLESAEMGVRARFATLRHFTVERFVAAIAEACAEPGDARLRAVTRRASL